MLRSFSAVNHIISHSGTKLSRSTNNKIMKLIASVITFLLIAHFAHAQQECVFDTVDQEKVLIALQKQYPGATLDIKQKTLETKWDKGVIRYQRGGCNHFGERITYVTSENSDFSNKNILFAQVVKMAKEFFRDLISGNELEDLLKKRKYSSSKSGSDKIYAIIHDQLIDLSIRYSRKEQDHSIEVGYYIN